MSDREYNAERKSMVDDCLASRPPEQIELHNKEKALDAKWRKEKARAKPDVQKLKGIRREYDVVIGQIRSLLHENNQLKERGGGYGTNT